MLQSPDCTEHEIYMTHIHFTYKLYLKDGVIGPAGVSFLLELLKNFLRHLKLPMNDFAFTILLLCFQIFNSTIFTIIIQESTSQLIAGIPFDGLCLLLTMVQCLCLLLTMVQCICLLLTMVQCLCLLLTIPSHLRLKLLVFLHSNWPVKRKPTFRVHKLSKFSIINEIQDKVIDFNTPFAYIKKLRQISKQAYKLAKQ